MRIIKEEKGYKITLEDNGLSSFIPVSVEDKISGRSYSRGEGIIRVYEGPPIPENFKGVISVKEFRIVYEEIYKMLFPGKD